MNEAYLQHAVDCSFVDMVDKNVFVSLRGGRLITGVLRYVQWKRGSLCLS